MRTLPICWKRGRGSDAFKLVRGVSYTKTDARSEPGVGLIPILRATNIQSGRIIPQDFVYVPAKYVSSEQFLKPGDILIATSSGSRDVVGKTAIVGPEHSSFAFGAFCAVARPKNEIVPEWLAYFTRSDEYRKYVEEVALGININNFRTKDLVALPLPLAPTAEQRRIVTKLGELFDHFKSARDELARIPRLVERYKQAILTAAFRGELTLKWRTRNAKKIESATCMVARTQAPTQPRGGRDAAERVIPGIAALSVNHPGFPAPEGWSWVPLTRIARQETGHTPSRSHSEWWGGDVSWIGIKDARAHHGGVIADTLQTTNREGLANSAARILPAGTVCLSRTASVGYVVIMGRPMATSQDFVTWSCTESLLPKFLMYALMAEGEDIRRFGKGSTHTTIYFPEVRALHICLAPIEEQQLIVDLIEAAFTRMDKLAAEAQRAASLLNRLEQATLAKAFRGELVK